MTVTTQTLSQQMGINEMEIDLRKSIVGFTDSDAKILVSNKKIIDECIDDIVSDFYSQQVKISEISKIIGDADTLSRLQKSQKTYLLDMFQGTYGDIYVTKRLRIGRVHKRMAVEPKLYMSSVMLLKSIVIKFMSQKINNENDLTNLLSALEKLFYFDTTLVIDTYIDSILHRITEDTSKIEQNVRLLEKKLEEKQTELIEQTIRDPLTKLYNQRFLQETLQKNISFASRNGVKIAFVYFNIDKFNSVNERYGYMKGDEVLVTLAKAINNTLRGTDTGFRYGGDEFCMILPDCDAKGASLVCTRVAKEFSSMQKGITFSFGVAVTGSKEYVDSDKMLVVAVKKMFTAKKAAGFTIIL